MLKSGFCSIASASTTAVRALATVAAATPKPSSSEAPLSEFAAMRPGYKGPQKLLDKGIEIRNIDDSDLWIQMRELSKLTPFSSQDEATFQIYPKLRTTYTQFAVRKEDNQLVGTFVYTINKLCTFGNFFLIRADYRDQGIGDIMTQRIVYDMKDVFSRMPSLGRAVPRMYEPYQRAPAYFKMLPDEMFSMVFGKQQLLKMFPSKTPSNFAAKNIKDLNADEMRQLIAYDAKVVGYDRPEFLTGYFGFDFTKGIALFGDGECKGYCGLSPSMYVEKQYKLAPLFAENRHDAAYLLHQTLNLVDDSHSFILHIRTNTSGGWMINRAREVGAELKYVGTVGYGRFYDIPAYTGQVYNDPVDPKRMYIPMNSPAQFDA